MHFENASGPDPKLRRGFALALAADVLDAVADDEAEAAVPVSVTAVAGWDEPAPHPATSAPLAIVTIGSSQARVLRL
jgi:hypothetical protein